MINDPIVEETRRVREQLLEQVGDLKAYAARLREVAEASREKLVTLEQFRAQRKAGQSAATKANGMTA